MCYTCVSEHVSGGVWLSVEVRIGASYLLMLEVPPRKTLNFIFIQSRLTSLFSMHTAPHVVANNQYSKPSTKEQRHRMCEFEASLANIASFWLLATMSLRGHWLLSLFFFFFCFWGFQRWNPEPCSCHTSISNDLYLQFKAHVQRSETNSQELGLFFQWFWG